MTKNDDTPSKRTSTRRPDDNNPVRQGSDRNLLFGVLALQLEFITRDQLVVGMNRWVLKKEQSLGEILIEEGVLRQADCQMLDAMVDRHVELHEGNLETSLASLNSVTTVPDELLAIQDSDVERSLAGVMKGQTDDPDRTREWSVGASAEGGRFQILRPHARGGLGEVFVARDEELGREVALKQIQDGFADASSSRSRFVQEAEITGGLEHPGIVPVYGMGKYEDGRPFYAMRFIHGDSLKQAVDHFHHKQRSDRDRDTNRSFELRKLLRRFIDACHAIDYAHSRGILHRDVKPGNVMLGKHGETLVVDWGLAKPIGKGEGERHSEEPTLRPESSSGASPTQMGSALGTPAYMSPEQAHGRLDQLGPESDIYSLGATLYVILTGRAPFIDPDHGTVLNKVKRGEFKHPRELHPDVPRPLEAICLKAMALERHDRYASASDLAEDVERWLADEPIHACSESMLVRAARWSRKHQSATSAIATAVVIVLIATSAGIWWYQHNQAVERTKRLVQDQILRRDVDDILTRVAMLRDDSSWQAADTLIQRLELRLNGPEHAELRMRADQARRDLETAKRLEDLLYESIGAFDAAEQRSFTQRGGPYDNAFRDYGIPVLDGEPDTIGKQIAASDIKSHLLRAVDDWMKWPPDSSRESFDHFLQVRESASPDSRDKPLLMWMNDRSNPATVKEWIGVDVNSTPGEIAFRARVMLLQSSRQPELRPFIETLLRSGFARHPDSFEIHFQLARLFETENPPRLEEALGHYHAAIALRPDVAAVYTNAGVVLSNLGRPKRAVVYHHRAVELNPNSGSGLGNLAVALSALGRHDEAAALTSAALRLKRDEPLWHANLINTLCEGKRYAEAVEHGRQAVALFETNADVRGNYARALVDIGQLEEAEKQSLIAIQLNPRRAMSYINLGSALNRLGRFEYAVAALRKAIDLDSNIAVAHANLAHSLLGLEKFPEAEQAAREAKRLAPGLQNASSNLIAALQAQGRLQDAIEELQASTREARRLGPRLHNAAENLIVAFQSQGRLQDAIEELQASITQDPQSVLLVSLSDAYWKQGNHKAAEEAARRAVQLDPNSAVAHNCLGLSLEEQGRHDEAEVACRKAVELDDTLANAHANLGRTLGGLGEYGQAEDELRRALELDPSMAIAHNNLGWLLSQQNRLQDAIEEYRKATELDPRLGVAHENLAIKLSKAGKHSEAVVAYKNALDVGWERIETQAGLARTLRTLNRFDEAEEAARRAIEKDPNHWRGHDELALALMQQRRYKEAETAFKAAIECDIDGPKSSIPRTDLAKMLLRLNRDDEAFDLCQDAIAATPESLRPHAVLCKLLAKRGDFEEAINLARGIVGKRDDIAPKEMVNLMSIQVDLGASLQKLGRHEEAIQEFEALDERHPGQPPFQLKLAESLKLGGRVQEAAETLRKLLGTESLARPIRTIAEQNLKSCERFVVLDKRLTELGDNKMPASAKECLELAAFCNRDKGDLLKAVRFYERAFATDELTEVRRIDHRLNAAFAAAAVASGRSGKDSEVTESQRLKWRTQAFDWMDAEFDEWKRQIEKNMGRQRISMRLKTLADWKASDDAKALADNAPERWTAIWEKLDEVSSMLGR